MPDISTQANLPPIDFTRLDLVTETPAEKLSLLALFFSMAGKFVATMDGNRRIEDFPRWKDAAHSLKGSAANLGMAVLEDLCRGAEKAASLTEEERTALLQRIRDELARIEAYLALHNLELPKHGA